MTKNKKNLIYIIVLIILGFIIYSNTFKVPFQFDDLGNIRDNSLVHNLNNFTKSENLFRSRLFGYFTFALNYHFSGENTFYYHLVNLSIHITNSILVFLILSFTFSLKKISNDKINEHHQELSFLSALIFLTHPIQTQAVTYIVQRFTSLSALFYLSSLLIFINLIKQNDRLKKIFLIILLTFCFFLAIFTKENAITIPIILFIYYFFFLSDKIDKNKIKKIIPLLFLPLLIGIYIIYRFYPSYIFTSRTNYQNELITPFNYFLTQSKVFLKYLELLIYPLNQSIDHLIPISQNIEIINIIVFAIIILILYLAFKLFKKNKLLSFSILCFFISLSIESSLIPLADPMYEHRLYLPLVGFTLFIVISLFQLFKFDINKTRKILYLIILILAILTFRRNIIWQTEERLWQDVVFQYPQNKRALNNLTSIYIYQKNYPKALDLINQILTLDPNYAFAYLNLGNIFFANHDSEKALEYYLKADNLHLRNFQLFANLGELYLNANQLDKAETYLLKSIDFNMNWEVVLNNLAIVYIKKNDQKNAKIYLQKLIEFDKNNSLAYANLGIVYVKENNLSEAIKNFQKALELNPNDQNSKSNLKKAQDLIDL